MFDYLKKLELYEDTLVVLVSDNGASGEGGPNGSVNEHYHLLSMKWPPLADEKGYEKIGTEDAQNNYPPGWAWAGNTPLKLYKTWVHAGGIKVPMIISYPMVALDLQSDVDLSQCARIIANIEYDSAYAIQRPSLQIEDISFTEYSGHFYATPGRVVNHNQYDVDNIVPIIALYDRDDNFVGVNITSKSLNVKAGEKLGFSGESIAPLPLSAFSKEELETFNIIAFGSFYSELTQ